MLTELTDKDAVAVGITMALQFGPALVIGPYAGILADRFARAEAARGHADRARPARPRARPHHRHRRRRAVDGLPLRPGPRHRDRASTRPRARPSSASSSARRTCPTRSRSTRRRSTPRASSGPPSRVFSSVVDRRRLGHRRSTRFTFLAMLSPSTCCARASCTASRRRRRRAGSSGPGSRTCAAAATSWRCSRWSSSWARSASTSRIFTATMASVEFGRGAGEFGLMSSVLAIGSVTGALLLGPPRTPAPAGHRRWRRSGSRRRMVVGRAHADLRALPARARARSASSRSR